MANNKYEQLKPRLGPDQKALILIKPDPDSLASAWALAHLFKKARSSAEIALFEPIKRIENRNMVKFLRIPVSPFKAASLPSYSRLCLVDAQPNQFPELEDGDLSWDIVIDHHPIVDGYSYLHSDLRPETGATSTIMTQYLLAAKVPIRERLATALCYGIITDTDHFQRNMTREDALAFSALFPRVNYTALKLIEQTEIAFRHLPYLDLALHRLKVKSRRAVLSLGAVETADIAVILADFFIRVSGIEFVAVAGIEKDKLVIIFRSRNLKRDAGKIAKLRFSDLGAAGGHRSAARAEIPLERLPPEVKLYNPDAVEEFIAKRLRGTGKGQGR